MKKILAILLVSYFFSCNKRTEKSITPLNNDEYAVLIEQLSNNKTVEKDSLNIQFQLIGFLEAFSNSTNAEKPNGEYRSENYPKIIDKAFPKEKLTLFLSEKEYTTFAEEYFGQKLYLVNSTNSKIDFFAQDSRLDIQIEALDKNGNWKAITYLPSSSCGNSYHTITLDENEYWEFSIPVFKGEFKTKIRYSLNLEEDLHLKSNKIDAFINLEQLDENNRQDYYPTNIMDPSQN